MPGPDLGARIDAATAYEEVFVPALFQDWSARVVAAARLGPGDRVLDVACGTGVLARSAAAAVGRSGSVVGLDLDPGMLAVAGRLAPYITWQQGPAEALPYPDESFDAVLSQFGLMFFRDRRGALAEMHRVLRPGGRLAVAVWDALAHIPAYAAEVELLERHAGPAAADALRAPFALGDRAQLERLVAEAGVVAAAVTTQAGSARFPSIRAMVLPDLRGWLPLMGINLEDRQVEAILADAEPALELFTTPGGAVRFPIGAHLITAVKPAVA